MEAATNMEGNDSGLKANSKFVTSSNDTAERRKAKNKKKSKNKKVKAKKQPILQELPPWPAKEVGNEAAPSRSHSEITAPKQDDIDFDVIDFEVTNFEVYESKGITKLTQPTSRFPRAKYKCTHCEYFCDDMPTVDRHLQEERHIKREEVAKYLEGLSLLPLPPTNILKVIERCLTDATIGLGLTVYDYKFRNKYKDNLNKKISHEFPGCYFELYGSSLTRFGFKDSDLNLNFNVPPKVDGPTALFNLKSWLEKQQNLRDVTINVGCEVPLITFRDNDTDILCDVALNNTEAVKLSELLSNYGALDDRVLPLGIAFRHWAEVCKLASRDEGGLPKYGFAVMTVFYLQHVQPPVLPVAPIVGDRGKNLEAQWGTKRTSWQSGNVSPVGELWLDMLKYFSVRYPISDYVIRIDKRGVEKSNGRKKMIVEDPFQPKINIAQTVISSATIEYFLHCMRTTFKYFSIPNTADGPIYHQVIRGVTLSDIMRKKEAQEEIKRMLRRDERFKKRFGCHPFPQHNASSSANTHSHLTVTLAQARTLNSGVNEEYVYFNFSPYCFTGGKKLPLVCTFCLEENHTKKTCPLKRHDKLVQMTAEHIRSLDRVCEYILEKFSQSPKQIAIRKSIVVDLEEYISELYPHVKLELFGSSCNGFGLQNSDLDICFTLIGNDGMALDFLAVIETLVGHLKKYKCIRNIIPITSAKVPIIKFNHYASDINGDISIYNILAQNNTRLLKVYSDIDRRVKILGHVLKRFAKLCDICDASRGSLSSYAYILMMIYFLQQCEPPVLPVLQELPEGRSHPEKFVEGWDVYFYDDIANLKTVWPNFGKNKTSVGSLWCELLNFYAEKFDFKTHVVSIRQKEPLLRFSKMWTTKCMAIEDPFDLNHNLASGLSRQMHLYIIKAFKKGQVHFRNSIRGNSLTAEELEVALFRSDKLIEGEAPKNNRCRNMRNGNGATGRKNKNKKSEEVRAQKKSEVIRSPVKQGGKFEQAISYGRVVQPFERNPKDSFYGKRNHGNHAFSPNTTKTYPADLRNWRHGSGHRAENMVQSRVVQNSALKGNMNGPLAPQPPFRFQRSQQQMKPAFPSAEVLEQRVEILGNNSPPRRVVDISNPSRR